LWLFATYLYLWTTLGVLTGLKHPAEFATMFLIYLEGVLLFWTAYNLLQDSTTTRIMLCVFAVSCCLMAFLLRYGVLESSSESAAAYSDRLTGLGQDPNILAGNLALGILMTVGLAYGMDRTWSIRSLFFLLPIPLLGICLVYTGSRGGMLALAVGLLGFTLKPDTIQKKLLNSSAVVFLLLFFVWASYHTGTIWNRYERTLEDGNMSAREQIYPVAWAMFLERPLIGWGPIENRYALATRTAEDGRENPTRDAHNLWLELLTATGLVGAVPFVLAVILCARAAWRARAREYGVMPSVLLVTVLALNLSVNWIQSKQDWLAFAFCCAGAAVVRKRNRVVRQSRMEGEQPPTISQYTTVISTQ